MSLQAPHNSTAIDPTLNNGWRYRVSQPLRSLLNRHGSESNVHTVKTRDSKHTPLNQASLPLVVSVPAREKASKSKTNMVNEYDLQKEDFNSTEPRALTRESNEKVKFSKYSKPFRDAGQKNTRNHQYNISSESASESSPKSNDRSSLGSLRHRDIFSDPQTPDTDVNFDIVAPVGENVDSKGLQANEKARVLSAAYPTRYSNTAEDLILRILEISQKLQSMKCLKPRLEVNQLFGDLVEICIQILPAMVTNKIMNDDRILSILIALRETASVAECLLESHWANLVVTSDPAVLSPSLDLESFESQDDGDRIFSTLKTFPYFQNYVDLARMELSAILPLLAPGHKLQKLAFIGSGPLPLTSLCISHLIRDLSSSTKSENGFNATETQNPEASGLEVLNIDNYAPAIQQSQLLCQKLSHHARGMAFALEPAGSPSRDLSTYDVVFLAALVGSGQAEKEEVLLRVMQTMRPGALVVVRTSHSLRMLLYPEFDYTSESILEKLDIQVVVHPCSHIVNSIVVGRVK